MRGFRGDGDLFCLSNDLVHIQVVMRIILLKTNLYRANRIMDQNGEMEQVGKVEGKAEGDQEITWPFPTC